MAHQGHIRITGMPSIWVCHSERLAESSSCSTLAPCFRLCARSHVHPRFEEPPRIESAKVCSCSRKSRDLVMPCNMYRSRGSEWNWIWTYAYPIASTCVIFQNCGSWLGHARLLRDLSFRPLAKYRASLMLASSSFHFPVPAPATRIYNNLCPPLSRRASNFSRETYTKIQELFSSPILETLS